MTSIWWEWDRREGFREMTFDFTIHSDPGNFSDQNGLYLMVCSGDVLPHTVGFYFGLQTNVYDPNQRQWRGKGAIFSRWYERDLAFARPAEEGWTQSSGHEGDFIGVRTSYDWGIGDYRMKLAPDGSDEDGEWFGVWVTDLAADKTTWVGSLKFPPAIRSTVRPSVYSTLEIYGAQIRPIDIPEWRVTVKRPLGDVVESNEGHLLYSVFHRQILNADSQYVQREDVVHFHVGGVTKRTQEDRWVRFR